MQFWTLCVLFVALCRVSDVWLRLKSPFRPSATYFDGAKVGNPWLRFRPDFVGFLRPDTYVALCVVSATVMKKRFRLCAVATGKARHGVVLQHIFDAKRYPETLTP
ncbi:hypothetical protein, partial [Pseudomonas syringae]|uniref:hypothetical protein n=1 Tax=Pseudomonas syringae TaxID=317 RepID=UPI001ABB3C07